MPRKKLRTPEDIWRESARKGVPIAALARAHGLPVRVVYDLLSGRNKGLFGMSHVAAVKLGLKEGDINRQGAV